MKVLVTGANGQLGYDVIKRLETEGIEYLGADRSILDITNEGQVKRIIRDYNPDVVIHCAAYTAVDKAEDKKELCYAVNVLGTRYVAEACEEIDAKMIYFSTDYVFDGEGTEPFTEDDSPSPINYYGQTKYEGELEVQKNLDKHFIVRISWVFGGKGNNFVNTMLKLGREKDHLTVVSDQIGSPTSTYDLAVLISEIIETNNYGVYHATNEGYCSWYDFACEIFRQSEIDVNIMPIDTEHYPTRAKRPKNSRLSNENLERNGFNKLPEWKRSLRKYLS